MYASALFLLVGLPLLLAPGSAIAFSALFILGIAWRAYTKSALCART